MARTVNPPAEEPAVLPPRGEALRRALRAQRARPSVEYAYRQRWQHDKVVRSTHGVNCTGSCSWKVYVKDGIITWSRSRPTIHRTARIHRNTSRAAARAGPFSWYTYSPIRIKYPYVRGVLVEMYREAKEQVGDPVEAWAAVVEDPEKSRRYKAARGKGGLRARRGLRSRR